MQDHKVIRGTHDAHNSTIVNVAPMAPMLHACGTHGTHALWHQCQCNNAERGTDVAEDPVNGFQLRVFVSD